MQTIIELGIAMILFLQNIGDWLATPMRMITFLGNEEFYLFVAPAIYWCLDAALGLRLGLGLMISGLINSAFKIAIHGPRPFWVDAKVTAFSSETSFGAPSGHAQNATVVWGILAKSTHKKWGWILAGVLIFLIGLSRMYLAVHFPHDVLLGWSIGALILWAMIKWEKPFTAWFSRFQFTQQILLAFFTSAAAILFMSAIRYLIRGWVLPEAWALAASQAYPDADPIAPLALSSMVSNAGTFFGLAVGGLWLNQRGYFDARGPLWQRLLRFLLGVIGVFILWFGLGEIFPRGETLAPYILRYIRYALVGLWISGIAPWLFIQIKIAQPTRLHVDR